MLQIPLGVMTRHTPGPWALMLGRDGYAHGVRDCRGQNVINWRGIAAPQGVGRYNALLLAAAPDLLEALRDAALQLEYLNTPSRGTTEATLARVYAAIAKTAGRDD